MQVYRLCLASISYQDAFVAVLLAVSAIDSISAFGAQAIRTDCFQLRLVIEPLGASPT